MRGMAVALVIAAGGAVVLAASGSFASSGSVGSNAAPGVTASPGGHPASADVSITNCVADPATGYPQATLQITNHSSADSNYIVTVAFNSPDGKTQYDTGSAAAENLGSGQTTSQTADSFKSGGAGFICKLASVTRYASNG